MKDANRARAFLEALQKEVSKVAHAHGLSVVPANAWLDGSACHINLTVFDGDPAEYYAYCFNQHAERLGLHPAWLGTTVIDPETGEGWTVLGLDPDGGEDRPVRVVNAEKEAGHITTSQLIHWATHPQHL